MVIKTDGSLWLWGVDTWIERDDAVKENLPIDGNLSYYRTIPAKVMDNVAFISNFDGHYKVIKTDGSLWAAGGGLMISNNYGQMGTGTTNKYRTPVKIMDNVASIHTSGHATLAVKTDGSLWTWGGNTFGGLGDGTTDTGTSNVKPEASRHTPLKIMDNVASVSVDQHVLAIKTDGSLWAWGRNHHGQVGAGTIKRDINRYIVHENTPVKIMDNVASVSAGHWFSAAIQTDGSIWAWGYNRHGQVGDGTTADKLSPVRIAP
jgi:alpha-tubulin suppressor-like RCC1 family protein